MGVVYILMEIITLEAADQKLVFCNHQQITHYFFNVKKLSYLRGRQKEGRRDSNEMTKIAVFKSQILQYSND